VNQKKSIKKTLYFVLVE